MVQSHSYIAALDVGTTTIRCIILDSSAQTVGSSRSTIKLIYPKPGFVEINPNQLWEQILEVVKNAISDANLSIESIKCLGISTQRATFLTWSRDTGEPFHNFITWKDIRAKKLCKDLNASPTVKLFRYAAYSLYLVTRSDRFLTGSRLKLASNHVSTLYRCLSK
jgi:putative glycerol kinase 5